MPGIHLRALKADFKDKKEPLILRFMHMEEKSGLGNEMKTQHGNWNVPLGSDWQLGDSMSNLTIGQD